MHLTLVDTVVIGADAFFPRFDAADWRITTREAHLADATHTFGFEFVDYARVTLNRAKQDSTATG